ncbi:MAG TPA: hypothetical protein VLF69_02920 [Candidatus Saccharimonadales bacterium]|nr:hypothetical protein [Candidatus Saccharimonadales bacterium]
MDLTMGGAWGTETGRHVPLDPTSTPDELARYLAQLAANGIAEAATVDSLYYAQHE